ncbi:MULTISPECIES: phytochelatin synthase family protein [Giesbergeria]|uniref:glutathione gamma-glutamylcysteinyltransferase n=1 Tax=Giesbergeria sinuosa TaxID=80883 RepID=A0ABV9QGD1_9BURK
MKNIASWFEPVRWCSGLLTVAAVVALPQPLMARELIAPPATVVAAGQPLEIPNRLFALSHPIGQQRLLQSDYRQAYWPLATYFETQRNQAYCSVATSVMALNALGVPRPATVLYPDFPFFTQEDFFANVDRRIADPEVVARKGMTLEQLEAVLGHYTVTVEKVVADTLDASQLRELLKKHLREQDRFVLLNFNRRLIGQAGGGHWSPLAAYHEASDSVLLMDVARYKYPPVWVPLVDLLQGAQNHDSVSGKARGLLIVTKKN